MSLSAAERVMLDDFVLNQRRSSAQVKSAFRAMKAFFGAEADIVGLTTDRIRAYAAHRIQDHEHGSVATELRILRRALRLMVECGKLERVPPFPKMQGSPPRQGFFERSELDSVLQELREDLRPIVEFYYSTGWRLQEGLGLRWPCVDFTQGEVRLEPGTTKNGRGRTFPFGVFPALGALLRGQRARVDVLEREGGRVVPWVFPNVRGGRIRSIRKAWNSACLRAGYPGRLIHDLRRTCVRNLVRAGVSRRTAMLLTGHKTESIFNRYDIVDGRDLRDAVGRYARFLTNPGAIHEEE